MKLSQLIAKLSADLDANGDTENVSIGVAVAGEDGKFNRLDAVLTVDNAEILRDTNFVNGMACIVADYHGNMRVIGNETKVEPSIRNQCEETVVAHPPESELHRQTRELLEEIQAKESVNCCMHDQELEDGKWYLIHYELPGTVYRVPAVFKKNMSCFYSYELSGIPSDRLKVVRKISTD